MRSFAGGRLTFLKLGSARLQWVWVGVSGTFLKAMGSQILAFQCNRGFSPVA